MHIVPIVEYVLAGLAAYLAAGLIFAALFATRWAKRLDAQAGSGTWGFRMAIMPATAALWPILILRLTRDRRAAPEAERPLRPESLRVIQTGLFALIAIVVPLVAAVSLAVRQELAAESPTARPEAAASDGRMDPLGGGIPASVRFSQGEESRRVEITVEKALAWPAAAMFWSPSPVDSTLPREAVFLGPLWGPAHLNFQLPAEGGWVAVVDFADGGKVLAARLAGETR
jgi:hypothetical protein